MAETSKSVDQLCAEHNLDARQLAERSALDEHRAPAMRCRFPKLWLTMAFLFGLVPGEVLHGQETPPAAELPPVPKGIEVLARGPVHEAFATPTGDPTPTKAVSKKPPPPLQEVPPA